MNKIHIVMTGGGTLFIGETLSKGGASSWLGSIHIPYSEESLEAYIGKVEKSVTEQTAERMAAECFKRSMETSIACTASLAKPDQRVGRFNGAYIYIYDGEIATGIKVQFFTGDRMWQEIKLAQIMRDIVVDGHFEEVKTDEFSLSFHSEEIQNLHSYYAPAAYCNLNLPYDCTLLMPGSFNPAHEGHRGIMADAERYYNRRAVLEISLNNFDKPPISVLEAFRRIGTMPLDRKVIITRHPLLYDKAQCMLRDTKKIIFILGADTYNRFANARDHTRFFNQKCSEGCIEFCVFDRIINGEVVSADFFEPSDEVYHATTILPRTPTAHSSTEIRNAANL